MKNWRQFKNNINESFVIPGIKIDDIIKGLSDMCDEYKKIVANHFNTDYKYVDKEDIRLFKLNDLTGDILRNNRVILKVFIIHDDDVEQIRNNITDIIIKEFLSTLPNHLDIFSIEIKPSSFINIDDLTFTISNLITNEKIIDIIKNITDTMYKGYIDGYWLFYKK